MMRFRRLAVATAVASLALAGCGVLPEAPEAPPTDWVPDVSPRPLSDSQLENPYGFSSLERAAYRIRNDGCAYFGTGSGFAIDPHTIITNEHVVAKPHELQVTGHDGRDITVASSQFSKVADIGVITTVEALDTWVTLADGDVQTGDTVRISGYPEGDELVVSEGFVLSRTRDTLANADFVFKTSAEAKPGSSGSGVYDEDGHIVGVLYAGDFKGFGTSTYFVPVSILRDILNTDDSLKDNKLKKSCK